MEAIERAVEILGGPSAAGRDLNVSHEAVRRWMSQSNGFAPERAIQLEIAVVRKVGHDEAAAMGARCENFLPDLEWERDRKGNVIAYRVRIESKQGRVA